MMLIYRLFLTSVIVLLSNAADILLLSSLSSISHSRWYEKLALLLANNGHQIVVLDTDRNFFEHPNVTHRMMDGGYGWLKDMEEQVKSNPDGLDSVVEVNSVWDNLIMLSDPSFIGCDVLLNSQGTKKFIKEYKGKKFDLIIADDFCEAFYGFVYVFGNPPLIPASPYLEVISSDFVGVYDNPSYVPLHITSLPVKMNFYERIMNTIYTAMSHYVVRYHNLPNSDKVMKEVFGPSVPKLADILKNNVPLVMTGFSQVIQGAKPLPPNYIPIPAFHAEPPKPLPQNIKTFLDGAKDGAILFSMGSNFKSILMSEEKREMFLSVFRTIPQRVIWKLELENSTEIPSNVMITKWLPQNDILGHPNVKAFISHGGLLGTHEAVYHGVPVIGLPLMFDQIHNIESLQRHGVAIRLYYKQLNKKHIALQIDKILNDPSYMYNMKQLSAAFKDTPDTPQERALFWIQYVLRNTKNNNKYIKSSSLDLEFCQRLLLDIFGFFIICIIVIYISIKTLLTLVSKALCGSKTNVTNSQKRKVQ